jgi:hypothetical protein
MLTRSKAKKQTKSCQHCEKKFDPLTNWYLTSRCCSSECSDNLKRKCGYLPCNNTFTRGDGRRMITYCSMECGGKNSANTGGIECPLFY